MPTDSQFQPGTTAASTDVIEERKVFSLSALLGFLGYSAYVSWVLGILLFGECSPLFSDSSPADRVFAVFIFSAILIVLSALSKRLANLLVRPRWLRTLGIVAFVAFLLAWALSFLPARIVPLALGYLCLSLLWAVFLGGRRWVFRYCTGALIVGGAICVLSTAMNEVGLRSILWLLPICSLTLFFGVLPDMLRNWEPVCVAQSAERHVPHISGMVTTLCDGLLGGLAAYCVMFGFFMEGGKGSSLGALLAGVFTALLGTALLIDGAKKMYLSEKMLLKTYVIRIMPALFFLCFMPQFWVGVLGCYLLGNVAVHLEYVTAATAEQVRFNQLNAISPFSTSKLLICGGFTGGWLIGYAAFSLAPELEFLKPLLFFLLLLALLVLSTFLFQDNSHITEQETEIQIDEIHVAGGGAWKRTVEQIAKEVDLSPRQTEVLFLLARGRNARYIQEQFYISKATAKAHIYSIYRKAGIHSQQGLIDLIESRWKKH
ncbi:MAG: helix-turn-helix transcriptional regulator [Coriobacteriales bacterium]|jgi:DNA-binding CsgD family transcriptional regulator|nr:helix-turn-helix transcriptional regulator [Coriobacteriales bacterium]